MSKLAHELACQMLSKNPQNPEGLSRSIVERQMAIGSYPNFFALNRERLKEDSKTKILGVEHVRKLQHFLAQSPAIPGWLVVIVDPMDDLNHFSANALLKSMEEPPSKTLILGLCHRLGNLLPTLRSRCQKLFFPSQVINSEHNLNLARNLVRLAQKKQFDKAIAEAQEALKHDDFFDALLLALRQCAYENVLAQPLSQTSHRAGQALNELLERSRNKHLDKKQLLSACLILF
jgi:DNA polymerase III delta prime subunit